MPDYHNVSFIASYPSAALVPASTLPEISFVGRSNVGKSSIMNKLFERKGLVKVSSTPGKTRAINFFDGGDCHFVDLPGYGYAQVSKAERDAWRPVVEGYFEQERNHALICVLVDIRHDASKLDVQMVEYLAAQGLPYCIVFTKADKLSRAKQQKQIAALCRQLAKATGNGQAVVLTTSSESGQGIDDLRALVAEAVAQPAR